MAQLLRLPEQMQHPLRLALDHEESAMEFWPSHHLPRAKEQVELGEPFEPL